VLIEAIVMDVSLGDELAYGVSYAQNGKSLGQIGGSRVTGFGGVRNSPSFLVSSNATQPLINSLDQGFSYFTKFGGTFDAAVTAAASDSRINVLSRPSIQTSHAVPCRIFIGETRPYITGTSFGGTFGSQNSVSQLRIGIDLSVTPLINPDGLVVMDIEQRIDEPGRDVPVGNGAVVPATVERSASAKVSVRDRDTIMLGGFIKTTRKKDKSGVPLLKDIPLLGVFFRSNMENNERKELIVLIRPTVLPSPADAALAATHYRSALPGILKAEKDFADDERKRLEASNRGLYRKEGFSSASGPPTSSLIASPAAADGDSAQTIDPEVRKVLDKAYASPPEPVIVTVPMDSLPSPAVAPVAPPLAPPAPIPAPVSPSEAETRAKQEKATRDLYRREGFKP
jgi:type II secretory pathway component GspD/PulD (secretin)